MGKKDIDELKEKYSRYFERWSKIFKGYTKYKLKLSNADEKTRKEVIIPKIRKFQYKMEMMDIKTRKLMNDKNLLRTSKKHLRKERNKLKNMQDETLKQSAEIDDLIKNSL
ncbi:MAG: hypothetical protein ACXAC7_15730 [Candidatus Hodarchaeales archaeon]|jgi:hypothetical protein